MRFYGITQKFFTYGEIMILGFIFFQGYLPDYSVSLMGYRYEDTHVQYRS